MKLSNKNRRGFTGGDILGVISLLTLALMLYAVVTMKPPLRSGNIDFLTNGQVTASFHVEEFDTDRGGVLHYTKDGRRYSYNGVFHAVRDSR